jgi:hypothetical protein
MRNLTAAGIGFEVIDDPCCDYCTRCDPDVIELRGVLVHPSCVQASWRSHV